MNDDELPHGVRARAVDCASGLTVHVLEAGFETPGRPCIVLLHGFPELSYSWRKVLIPLAAAGYYVVAPDQRGYGRTTGWDARYDGALRTFAMPNLVADVVALVDALGIERVAAVVGHDFGSPVAGYCALLRPDLFGALVCMSAPFDGAPKAGSVAFAERVFGELAHLQPPRKAYGDYYTTREADADMRGSAHGLHAFLRAYYHVKSADWPRNAPHELAGFSAEALAELPPYYIMPLEKTMPETVAPEMPSAEAIAACDWLPDRELAVYARAFAHTGFQGALQWYRCRADASLADELAVYNGEPIDVPATYIAGASDWGIYQKPGSLAGMRTACPKLTGVHLIDGAGHWVQQERPKAVVQVLVEFLGRL